jgi:hypothetical protein
LFFSAAGAFISASTSAIPAVTAALQRSAAIGLAPAGAAYCQPIWRVLAPSGTVVDFTMRFYAANVELGTGNARPLLQRNVPEVVASIGDFDAEAVLAHVGTGDGFVTTWYDQSGNGRNAAQTTAGAQPRIVSNGVIETQNGRPTIRQLTGGGGFVASVPITSSTLTANAVASLDEQGVTGFKGLMAISNPGEFDYDSASRGVLILQVDALASLAGFRNAYTSIVDITIGSQFVATSIFDGTNNTLWKDGSAGPTVASAGNFSTTLLSVGERLGLGVSSPWIGTFSEEILFTSAFSTTDRQTLDRNQGAYYGIAVA